MLEAPAWAAWGKTLRRTPPTRLGGDPYASVALVTDKVEVVRTTKKPKLVWNHIGRPPVDYETPTKADEALERVLGDQTTWRRTHIFSSSDAALFSAATDGDRKRLLEYLIGLDVFDKALDVISFNNKLRLSHIDQTRDRLIQVDTRLQESVRHATDLKALLQGDAPPADPETLRQEMSRLMSERHTKQEQYQSTTSQITTANAHLQHVRGQQVQHDGGLCYACHQPIPDSVLERQREELALALQQAKEVEAAGRVIVSEAARAIADIDTQLRSIQDQLGRTGSDHAVREKLAQLKTRYKADTLKREELLFDLSVLEEDEDVYRHANRVLGLRGARSRILSHALGALESMANLYLGWINSNTTLRLLSSTEQVNGKPSDKISIQVDGYGGGHGYPASSGGERRRIDLALLLALASLSGSSGTLIFDEAFDALDDEGVASACELLSRISETRPVVVITHNKLLVQGLKGVSSAFER